VSNRRQATSSAAHRYPDSVGDLDEAFDRVLGVMADEPEAGATRAGGQGQARAPFLRDLRAWRSSAYRWGSLLCLAVILVWVLVSNR
jgi:hypothetical protein